MKQSHSLKNCVGVLTILLWLNPTATWASDKAAGPIARTGLKASPARHERAQALKLVACSADGTLYACATDGGRIKLNRTADGVAQRTFYLCRPESLTLSHDGQFLAAVGNSDGCLSELKVWKTTDGALVCRIETDCDAKGLLFSKDGAFLAAATSGSNIELWNVRSGMVAWSKTLPSGIFHLLFNKDELIAICADGRARRFALH